MNVKVLESALKHGLSEEDIKHAIRNCVCSKAKKNKQGNEVYACIGILANGTTCEVMFYINRYFEHVVFHAMSPARNQFVKEVQGKKTR